VESWPPARSAYASERILVMKSGKRSILKKMLYLHFMMMPVRHPLSALGSEITPILRENQYNNIRFDSLKNHHSKIPEPMIPSFHRSIIPIATLTENPGNLDKTVFVGYCDPIMKMATMMT
jgi:hypothetical protein